MCSYVVVNCICYSACTQSDQHLAYSILLYEYSELSDVGQHVQVPKVIVLQVEVRNDISFFTVS